MTSPIELDFDIIERGGVQDRLLVMIHGYGESPAPLIDRLDLIDPEGRFLAVAPHAPFDKDGHPLWHRALNSGSSLAKEQFAASVVALDHLLTTLETQTGLSRAAAVVGGFSQGGGVSLALLQWPRVATPPAAVFGISTFLPWTAELERDPGPVAGRPILLTGASEDRFAPVEFALEGAQSLKDEGFAVTYFEVPGQHEVTDTAAAHVGEWLTQIHAGETPANL